MKTTTAHIFLAVSCLAAPGRDKTASADGPRSHQGDEPAAECRPSAQLPIGLARTQTLRLNVTCQATPRHPARPCPVTLRFVDQAGLPVVDASSVPLELRTRIAVRGVASLDLPGHSFVGHALREAVRPVVAFAMDDFLSDRLSMDVELFDTATGRAGIRYVFDGCRTLPFVFVPASQRPPGFAGPVRELSIAPQGITDEETARLNVACNPDGEDSAAPCRVVLRYSPVETAPTLPGGSSAAPLSEREISIPSGEMGSFDVRGDELGATPGQRVMLRPSVVGAPSALGRLVTNFEIFDSATGVASSNNQPQVKRQPTRLR